MKRAKVKNGFVNFVNTNGRAVLFAMMFALIGGWLLVTSHAATGNDLVVTAVTMSPAGPAAGQAVTFSATVKNQGSTAVPAGVIVGVSFTVDGTKVSANESNTAGLAAGASVTLAASTAWPATSGPHTVVATADDTNAIPDEVDESNNTKRLDFAVGKTGELYLTPVTSSVRVGHNVKVALRLKPGTTVDGVQATVAYDATKLQFVGAETTGSPFDTPLQAPAVDSGSVTVASSKLGGGTSGDALVMTMVFKALASAGSTTMTVAGNATAHGVYTNPATTDAVISLTAPDTTAPTTSVSPPATGSNLVGATTISSTAADNVGVTKVELYVDGTLKGTVTTAPYIFHLNTTSMTNGEHDFQTKAYDAAGNIGSSTIVGMNVHNWAEDINQDGTVNLLDFSLLAAKYGQSGPNLGRADINGDGTVNLLDFNLLAAKFGQ